MYNPDSDSFLLSGTLKDYLKTKNKNIKILDMGSGSGVQAKTCLDLNFKNVLCVDIDSEAVEYLKKQKFKAIKSDLFSNLKNKKFDLISFNPPYLPESKYDKEKDTTGGKKGNEIIIKFLKQSKSHLTEKGEILLLFSSLSNPNIIKHKAQQLGFNINELSSKKLFFEELFVYELKLV